jgi:hypothetical protein
MANDYRERALDLIREWEANSRKDLPYAQSLVAAADFYLKLSTTAAETTPRQGRTNGEKVAAIRKAWHDLMPENPPITYGSGPVVNLDLFAQVAINVLTDGPERTIHGCRSCGLPNGAHYSWCNA